jgi:DNA-binding NarL/FixJ family response regulator
MTLIKVLIADNSLLIREGLKALIATQENLKVVAEAQSSEDLNDTKLIKSVDVLIIDFTEPDFKPEDISKAIIVNPKIKVLAISNQISKPFILRAIESGISGYVLKDCDKDEILEAVVKTKEGKNFFCGKILDAVMVQPSNEVDLKEIVSCCEPVDISHREMEIIRNIAEGLTNKEIADKLFLSTHTVNTHRKNIMQKLGIGNTAGLVMYALKEKIVTTEPD